MSIGTPAKFTILVDIIRLKLVSWMTCHVFLQLFGKNLLDRYL